MTTPPLAPVLAFHIRRDHGASGPAGDPPDLADPQVECVHRGALAVWRDEEPLAEIGDVTRPIYLRSALKPFQLVPLLQARVDHELGLGDRHLAVMTASHHGDARHVAAVRDVLAAARVSEGALRCGVHPPLVAGTRFAAPSDPIHHNCSGKHAGMLALARHLGADVEGYLDPAHPVQEAIRRVLLECTDMEPSSLLAGVDGCDAPAWRLPLREAARGLGRLFSDRATTDRLFTAAQNEPHYLAGDTSVDGHLVRLGGGRVFAKRGAEGVLALVVRDGASTTTAMLKLDDGSMRAPLFVARALLRRLGVVERAVETPAPEGADGLLRNSVGRIVGSFHAGPALETLDLSQRATTGTP